jgi:hypothetical protein
MSETELSGARDSRSVGDTATWRERAEPRSRFAISDGATCGLLMVLLVLALFTFRDYAITNDEGVQHHYGELIIAYYASGFTNQEVFNFQNLYLYGGLFDILAIGLSHLFPIDLYDLRHILCALTGIAGIGAAAATARLIAGPRAGLFAAITLSVSGVWYGAMFNHTKDIPLAAAMIGATFFLIRIARRLPSPGIADVAAFGVLTGAALGIRVFGLLLLFYAGVAIVTYQRRPLPDRAWWRFLLESAWRLLPAVLAAYAIMILAWPWAALAPLNPLRGLFEFSEFQYAIRTLLAGQVYEMAKVPRLYVPIYILIRTPLIMLLGAALSLALALLPRAATAACSGRREIALVAVTVFFPLACEVVSHGPAFSGLRHFLFVIPALAVLAGIGLDGAARALSMRGRAVAAGGLALMAASVLFDGVTLVRLHPYEYLFYNATVGGLEGASRRYDLDYWFSSMPEALHQLEIYLRQDGTINAGRPAPIYSVAVCGERLPFEKSVTLPELRWDFRHEWRESEFFIAPTQMNCDGDLDGKVVGTVERLGVVIAYVKDRRALVRPVTAAR